MWCPSCGNETQNHDSHCTQCGARVASEGSAGATTAAEVSGQDSPHPVGVQVRTAALFCSRCGAAHDASARFCASCGARFEPSGAYPMPGSPPAYVVAPRQTTNGFAIASMVLGIVWIYWIGSILALIFGYVARRRIAESNGREGGGGMATAGIVLGWIGVATLVAVIVIAFIAGLTSHPNSGGGYYGG